jgi:hypothetical protein
MSESKTKTPLPEQMKRSILQSTTTLVPHRSVEDELTALDNLLKEAGACLECGEVLVAHVSTWRNGPFPMRAISLRCPKCRPIDSDSPETRLRAAATHARDALAEIADQAEADGDLQLAHYCRHRVDALDSALAISTQGKPQP